MLYGLLLIPRGEAEDQLRRQCVQLREKYQWGRGEFKWEKVSQAKLGVYKEFVDLFFAHTNAEFRCLVVQKSKIDFDTYHQGDAETAFYEFYYQALSRNLRLTDEYMVFTDNRQNRQSNRLVDLKAKTNYHWLNKGARHNIVRNVEPRDSKSEDLLQIVDVLLGAVGYDVEKRAESQPKVEMVRHIAEKVGCSTLQEQWGRETRFNMWHFRFPENSEAQKQKGRHRS